MSLTLDELSSVVAWGLPELVGSRIRGVHATHEAGALVLECWRPGTGAMLLLLRVGDRLCRMHRISRRPPAPATPPAFVMLLRARILSAVLLEIALLPGDRIARLSFSLDDGVVELVAELTGRHGNALLLERGVVVSSLLPLRHDDRGLRACAPWVAPPAPPDPHRGVRTGWPVDAAPDAFIERWYDEAEERARLDEARQRLLASLKKSRARIVSRLRALEADIDRAAEAPRVRREADLLQGAWSAAHASASSITVIDWFDPATPQVTLQLDPTLDFAGNIEARYRRARKYERGAEHALSRSVAAEQDLATCDACIAACLAADAEAALAEVEATARGAGLCRRPQAPPSARAATSRLCYRPFTSTVGNAILVGRGGADNDQLTFRIARGNDIWMHIADFAGPHVIVRAERGEVPRTALEEAAVLAVWFSVARHNSDTVVTWTQRKHVRRAKDAPPGRVYVSEARSILVKALDEARVRDLMHRMGGDPAG